MVFRSKRTPTDPKYLNKNAHWNLPRNVIKYVFRNDLAHVDNKKNPHLFFDFGLTDLHHLDTIINNHSVLSGCCLRLMVQTHCIKLLKPLFGYVIELFKRSFVWSDLAKYNSCKVWIYYIPYRMFRFFVEREIATFVVISITPCMCDLIWQLA